MKTRFKILLRKVRDWSMTSYVCPKCGDWIDDDEDVCQTCGYPWTD